MSTKINKRWRVRNPQATKAHSILAWEIRCGRIKPKPCEVCNSTKNIHGHHEDYSKPLKVKWLCSYHHRKLHHPGEPKKIEYKSRKPSPRAIRGTREPHSPKRDDLLDSAIKLREDGFSYKSISIKLKMSKGTIYKWINVTKYN